MSRGLYLRGVGVILFQNQRGQTFFLQILGGNFFHMAWGMVGKGGGRITCAMQTTSTHARLTEIRDFYFIFT